MVKMVIFELAFSAFKTILKCWPHYISHFVLCSALNVLEFLYYKSFKPYFVCYDSRVQRQSHYMEEY